MFGIEGGVSYAFVDYLLLLVALLTLSMLASSILLVTSTIAKNIKEATSYALPIYIVSLMAPAMGMFNQNKIENIALYFIPIYNCTLGFKEILAMDYEIINYLIIIGSNVVYIGIIITLLIRLFKNERVLFSK
jgi:sodium transport system permease protein